MLSKRTQSKSKSTSKLSEVHKVEEKFSRSCSTTRRSNDVKEKLKNLVSKTNDPPSDPEPEQSDLSNRPDIPEVLRKQGTSTNCSNSADNDCPCNTLEAVEQVSKQISYSDRRNWISVDRLNELRKKAHEGIKNHRIFTIRGCFFSVRNALAARGWVEKLDVHRKYGIMGMSQVTYEDLAQNLPKRRPGESRRQYLIKCERNIMSRFLEHVPIDFLWTARREKCDWIDQAKNPSMIINRFHRAPFTSKEGLCTQLRDFHWFFEDGVSEMFFPRCYNVWSPEELTEFIENFRMTACIGFLKYIVEKYRTSNWDAVFAQTAKIPFSAIDFAFKRCNEFLDACNHTDIDTEDQIRIWEHDWDAFLTNHFLLTHEQGRIQVDPRKSCDGLIKSAEKLLLEIKAFWPQYNLDGCLNIWIVKPANKCRGRGIILMNNIKKILNMVNPPIATKSRYVVQKYLERPLIIHNTKFDIRQWFLVSSVQPLIIWMYKESYLRFSSQEYNLLNYHESVHLTNHAVQKKYRNGKRDERLPTENMWDCYTFQTYLRQIGQYDMWADRIYPGMQHAIVGAMLASQDNMDRRVNNFELFGADFMICEDFYPWLIEINSSPDLGATTSVTARMCPQCLEDTIKVMIDRKLDVNADTGNFEMIYRQSLPPVPAYMGLNLFLKGKQILPKCSTVKKERLMGSVATYISTCHYRNATPSQPNPNLVPMPTYRPNFELDIDRTPIKKATVIDDLLDNLLPIEAKRALTDGNLRPFGNKSPLISTLVQNGKLLRSATSPSIRSDIAMPVTALARPYTQNSLSSVSANLLEKKQGSRHTELRPTPIHPYSKRYFSCGPRIQVICSQPEEAPCDIKKLQVRNSDPGTIDESKLFAQKLNNNQENQGNRLKDTLSKQNAVVDRLYKSKSAKVEQNLKNLSRKKGCTVTPTPSSSNSVRRNSCSRKQATGNGADNVTKLSKLTPSKTIMDDYTSSPFYAVGMSLRAWKSRQNKSKKSSNQSANTTSNFRSRRSSGVTKSRQLGKMREKNAAEG
ncbi:unnamed protein product [Hermetia illucens]|uniref:Tubulin glycylase 3A n=1 Tax=Hermetia illucens TaxID=343691 RepID=A0A7R8YP18_HERIL|nr:tubulin glycylase 3A-like [Hermetia illucens]CAD7080163.1 unnamed protein product [Hermetia illucens]